MTGRQRGDQSQLFYLFNLERRIPACHLLRRINPEGTAAAQSVCRSSNFLRALDRRDRACNIDPPTSSYAIMRRARPYRGENTGPGRDDRGELDT